MYILMLTSAHSWQFVIMYISNLTFCLSFSYDKKKNQWEYFSVPVFIFLCACVCVYIEFFPLYLNGEWMNERRKKRKWEEENESSFHMITFWLGVRTLWTLIVKVREKRTRERLNDYCYFVLSVWLMTAGWNVWWYAASSLRNRKTFIYSEHIIIIIPRTKQTDK